VLIAMIGGNSMATPAGFFQAEIFSITAPIALAVLTVMMGARAMAGEEKDHTMGLLLANPIARSRIVIGKAGVMVLFSGIAAFVTFAATWIGIVLGGVELSTVNLLAVSVLVWLLSLVLGVVALVVAAFTGRTSIASYSAAGLGLIWYFLWAFGSISPNTEGFAALSPFHYYLGSDPLETGMDWSNAAVLALTFVVGVAVSVWAFDRRDLRG
jgi:ABC-2 type transport system permease protein